MEVTSKYEGHLTISESDAYLMEQSQNPCGKFKPNQTMPNQTKPNFTKKGITWSFLKIQALDFAW